MNDVLTLVVLLLVLAVVIGVFVLVGVKLRRGGGSLTTVVLGATDGFLTHDKSKAAESIVDENASKKFERLPSTEPHKK